VVVVVHLVVAECKRVYHSTAVHPRAAVEDRVHGNWEDKQTWRWVVVEADHVEMVDLVVVMVQCCARQALNNKGEGRRGRECQEVNSWKKIAFAHFSKTGRNLNMSLFFVPSSFMV
jgi:hypothetical protein